MGQAIGGLFGTAGGQAGTGIKGPSIVPTAAASSLPILGYAQQDTGSSLAAQNNLLKLLQGQNGFAQQNIMGNQQQALAQQLANSGGAANQSQVYGQGQNLAGQLALNNGAASQGQAMTGQQNMNAALTSANGVGAEANALGQQGGLNQQLAGANGVGAQVGALYGQGDLNSQLAMANGVGAQSQAIGNLQGLSGQYQDIANGGGPNPAQAMLNQQTGNNIANQAALLAGQRGAGANIGLMARQIGQQGAGMQQQAVGQAATMQANQQLAALGQIGAAQQAAGNLATNQVAAQQSGLGQQANIGAGLVGAQQAGIGQQANIGAGVANQQQAGINAQGTLAAQQVAAQQAQQQMLANQAQNQVQNQQAAVNAATGQTNTIAGQEIGQTNANTANQLQNLNQQQNAINAYNSNMTAGQNSMNAANSQVAATKAQGQNQVFGGLLGAAGVAAAAPAVAGAAAHLADGGEVEGSRSQVAAKAFKESQDKPVQGAAPFIETGSVPQAPVVQNGPTSSFGQFLVNRVSGAQMAQGGQIHDYRGGGNVKASKPSEKATVKGNSYANDKIKAVVSEGEVVIPRSIMQSKDPARGAADFVAKVLAKKRVS